MFAHEILKRGAGHAPIAASWNAIAVKSAAINPLAHGARGNFANHGNFASGENAIGI